MKARLRNLFTSIIVCSLLMHAAKSASAGTAHPKSSDFDIGPSKGEVVAAAVGIAAVGAAIGVGIYFVIKHNRSLTGCVDSTPNGLELVSDGEKVMYSLVGDVADVKSGDRIRVSGKKNKKATDTTESFMVEKVSKNFGSCKVLPAAN